MSARVLEPPAVTADRTQNTRRYEAHMSQSQPDTCTSCMQGAVELATLLKLCGVAADEAQAPHVPHAPHVTCTGLVAGARVDHVYKHTVKGVCMYCSVCMVLEVDDFDQHQFSCNSNG